MKGKDLKQVSEYACDYLFLQEGQEWENPDNHSKEYPDNKEAGCLKII